MFTCLFDTLDMTSQYDPEKHTRIIERTKLLLLDNSLMLAAAKVCREYCDRSNSCSHNVELHQIDPNLPLKGDNVTVIVTGKPVAINGQFSTLEIII